jgi:inner membrane protein
MDNLSHSVAGLAVGELLDRCLPAESDPARQRLRHRMLLITGWAAGNFPDLDLVLTPLIAPPLGYLLHHRGHTHTLLYAIPQALALLAAIWLLWPAARQLLRASPCARVGVAAAAALGLLLHVAMDYLNVYGVHPFHPFDSRWRYGDLVFIVEPVFWVVFGVPLAAMLRNVTLRRILLALLALVPALFALAGYLQWGSLAGLAVLGIGLAWLHRRVGTSGALAGAFAAALGLVGVQWLASKAAIDTVMANLPQRPATARVLDIPLSAFPANPVCWNFATVESDEAAGTYSLRRGVLSIAPWLTPAAACPAKLRGSDLPGAITPAIAWAWEEHARLARLRELQRTNCHFDAWMRFARVPSVGPGSATDVRFGLLGSANFSTLPYASLAGSPCPQHVPQWDYPRADLLTPAR